MLLEHPLRVPSEASTKLTDEQPCHVVSSPPPEVKNRIRTAKRRCSFGHLD
ncbi:MAG TPA: hypothetical protein VGI33_08255 [Paenibacillus sp.]